MADHMTAEQLLDAMADSLSRAVEQMWHECDCEACPECGQSPHACSGTECAVTCQCSICDHCVASSLIAEHKATVARPVTYGAAEQLRAELTKLWREMADFRCAGSEMTADAVHMYMQDYAEQLRVLAARLSGMAAVVPKGWKPLPPAATPEMVAAFWATPGDQSVEFRYVRMFAAAPEPPHV